MTITTASVASAAAGTAAATIAPTTRPVLVASIVQRQQQQQQVQEQIDGAEATALSRSGKERNRVVMTAFVASLFAMLCAGTIYLYSAYAPDVAAHLNLSQTEMNIVASAGGFGLYLTGPLFGFLADKHPISNIVRIAAIFLFLGYFGMALTYLGRLPSSLLSLCYLLVGVGSSGVFNSSLSVNVKNFPLRDHGFAVGLSVAFFGLSAFFFSQLQFFFTQRDHEDPTKVHVDTYHYLLFVGITTGLISAAASFFLIDVNKTHGSSRAAAGETVQPREEEQRPLLNRTTTTTTNDNDTDNDTGKRAYLPIFLKNVDASILFVAFILATGPGLMYINNIGTVADTIGESQGQDPGTIQMARRSLVSLISIFNCAGRIITGLVSDYVGRRFGTSRLMGLVAGVAVILVSQASVAVFANNMTSLYASTVLLGLGYGAIFSATPATVGAVFGTKSFGSNWGWFQWSPAIGGQLANLLFGTIMDAGKKRHCVGLDCFQNAFFSTCVFLSVGLVLLVILSRRRSQSATSY